MLMPCIWGLLYNLQLKRDEESNPPTLNFNFPANAKGVTETINSTKIFKTEEIQRATLQTERKKKEKKESIYQVTVGQTYNKPVLH